MPLRLIADASAQTTIALALTSGAASFVGQSTANFTVPQNFGGGVGRLTLLDSGNPAWNPAAPFATPFEYCDYTNNNTGTNTISGLTRGVAGTTPHSFFAGATVAQGLLAEDILASAPWKFDDQSPSGVNSVTIPAVGSIPSSYLGVSWRDICIKFHGQASTTGSQGVFLQFNTDTGAHYYSNLLEGSNVTVNSENLGATSGSTGSVTGTTSGNAGSGTIWIRGYNQTALKVAWLYQSFRLDGGATGNTHTQHGGGNWVPVTPARVTSILLFLQAGANWQPGSYVTTCLEP